MPQQNKIVCKYCQSTNIRKYGHYGETQLYYCNECKRKFTPSNYLFHMKTPANQVSTALDLYYKGLSIDEIREYLQDQYQNTPSPSTIFKWIQKFTDEAVKECSKFRPKVGDSWVADETYVRIDQSKSDVKNPYSKSKKGRWVIFWDIIDADTRFLLASLITTTRGTRDAKLLMEKAATIAGKAPRIVVTDKLAAYLDGTELAFGKDTKHYAGGPFDIVNNTNLIERLHGTIKERTKVMRGLRTPETAKRFLEGWMMYYDYMKPHEALDSRTPSEAARCGSGFRDWIDVTRMVKPEVKVFVTPAKTEIIPDTPVTKYRAPTRRLRKKRSPNVHSRRLPIETIVQRIGR